MSEQIVAGLNPAQHQAVQMKDGPVLVLAGPGAGKTGVIVRHVAHLMVHDHVDPQQILAVTFTNKAAREMRERLDAMLGEGRAAALTAGTFHSICARWLRREIHYLGRERDFAIYDSDDQQRVMKRVLKDLNLDEKKYPPRTIHNTISSAKNEYINAEEFARHARTYYDEIVSRCYARYQQVLRESNALDFDDLLVETVRLFELNPDVLERYQDRYQYILADEYQDTNRVQYLLLKQLASKYRNLFVVGDEDQSVYAFRGADIRNIRSFENDYPEATIILLEQNYRSTQSILNVAQAVINRSGKRVRKKQLWTENDKGTLVALQEGYDQDEEASFVASESARLISSGEFRPRDIAIMYRTNAQSRAVEEALIGLALPYYIVGGTRFYERKEVKDVLAYLRLAVNPFDSVSFSRVLNWPGRGIGQKSEDDLNRWANELSIPAYAALQLLAENGPEAAKAPFSARTKTSLLGFLALLDELIQARETMNLVDLLTLLLARVGVEEALLREYGEEEGRDRWGNVQEIQNVAVGYVNLAQEAQLPSFLEEVALVSDVDDVREDRDRLTCITLHQAKGLEFPVVFLVGLEEGLLPHSRSLDDSEALDEERRLFYVGATRAKQRLYLLYAFRRTSFGRTNISQPSRFLVDIPKEMLHQMPRRGYADIKQTSMFTNRTQLGGFSGSNRVAPRSANPSSSTIPERKPARAAGPSEASFFAGQKVRHASFGDGVVVSSKIVDGDEEVTVAFSGKGVKRLLASFARLEKVS